MCFVNKLSKMDLQEPSLDQHFVGHKGTITSLAFSPSDRQLVSSSIDKSFMNWNLLSSTGSLKYKAKNLPVTHVTFSPNGNLIASSQGQFVRLWMSTIHGKSVEFKAHFSTVRSVEFSPDSEHILTASDDKSLKVWKTVKRKFVTSLSGHTNWVRFAGYSPNGNLVVSCADDKTIRIWDPRSSKQIHRFNEVRGIPKHARFHPSGSCIGVAMSTDVAKIYDIRMMKLLQYYPCHEGPVNSLSFHPSGKFMLTGGKDKTCKILDLLEGRPIFSLEAHTESVTAVTFSRSGDYFASGSEDKNVLVWKSNLDASHAVDKNLQESFSVSKLDTPKSLKPSKHKVTINDSPVTVVYSAKDYEDSCSDCSDSSEDVGDAASSAIPPLPSGNGIPTSRPPSRDHIPKESIRDRSKPSNESGDAANNNLCSLLMERPLAETLNHLISSIHTMGDEVRPEVPNDNRNTLSFLEIKKMEKRLADLERKRTCTDCHCGCSD